MFVYLCGLDINIYDVCKEESDYDYDHEYGYDDDKLNCFNSINHLITTNNTAQYHYNQYYYASHIIQTLKPN